MYWVFYPTETILLPTSLLSGIVSKNMKPYKKAYLLKANMHIYYLVTFFLPATVLRLPFLVRLLVRVRWPRNGKPLRWRRPR